MLSDVWLTLALLLHLVKATTHTVLLSKLPQEAITTGVCKVQQIQYMVLPIAWHVGKMT